MKTRTLVCNCHYPFENLQKTQKDVIFQKHGRFAIATLPDFLIPKLNEEIQKLPVTGIVYRDGFPVEGIWKGMPGIVVIRGTNIGLYEAQFKKVNHPFHKKQTV